jgi:adenosylhomocysteine nucleosidase
VPPLPRFQRGYGYDLPAPLAADLRGALAGLELPAFSAAATGGAARRPRIVFGTVLTGDSLVNCVATRESLHARFGGQAVEMEGAAVAQVAERFAVPCVVVRALSDLAGADTTGMDFTAFVSEAAGVAAAVVRRIVPVL